MKYVIAAAIVATLAALATAALVQCPTPAPSWADFDKSQPPSAYERAVYESIAAELAQ